MSPTILSMARKWINMGIAVIPVRYRDKRPSANLLPDGKWEPFKTRLPVDTELQMWFSSSLHNIGLVVGWKNLVVIDFDNMDTYNKWQFWTIRKGGYTQQAAERTYQVQTARGMHIYVYTANREVNRKLDGVDIKAQNGYVLIPPSVHPSGHVYQAVNPASPILSIEALSDILPADLLASGARNTEFSNPGIAAIISSNSINIDDPWARADNPLDSSRDLIQQIRERHNILDWFPDAVKTSRDARWWKAQCPFHEDKNPSFWIDVKRGICGCFGGCTYKPLDVINLYARLYGIDEREAILWLSRL